MKNFLIFGAVTYLSALPMLASAQDGSTPTAGADGGRPSGITVQLDNPLAVDTLEQLLVAILNLIIVLMIPVIVFFIIWAGFKYVTARGNPATIGDATRALTYAIIGAVIILGAVVISQMVADVVNDFQANALTADLPLLAAARAVNSTNTI